MEGNRHRNDLPSTPGPVRRRVEAIARRGHNPDEVAIFIEQKAGATRRAEVEAAYEQAGL